MSLRHGLLGLLNYKPMTGYEINKEFYESLGHFWQAKSQSIYRELDAMEKDGWLISERIIQEEKPNKRVYSITAKGKTEFLEWLSSPETDIEKTLHVKNAFLMRVAFSGEASREQALDLLRSYREVCLAGIQKVKEADEVIVRDEATYSNDIMKYWKLVALHGEILRKARLEWAEKAIAILEGEEVL